ncbi:hypothetical protein, partial [Methylibium sp.]|uniref:hypothetical protein n=1 Tax=Methylibium sp. TaxID=2067992 RepID=UPI00286C8E25
MNKREMLKLAAIGVPAALWLKAARASIGGTETIVLRQGGVAPIDWYASGLFADGGTWKRHIAFQGVGPNTYEAETAPTLYGTYGQFRINMQMHANTVQGTGLYGTWVINRGNYLGRDDLNTGSYVNLQGEGA